jgi:hypothetical protein
VPTPIPEALPMRTIAALVALCLMEATGSRVSFSGPESSVEK